MSEKYIALGVRTKCIHLLGKFSYHRTVHFEDFAEAWREMNFTKEIFGEKGVDPDYIKEVLFIAREFWIPPNTFHNRVFGLYLMYGLYFSQPRKTWIFPKSDLPNESARILIRITCEDLEAGMELQEIFIEEHHFDALYIFIKLLKENAFTFCYTKHLYGVELDFRRRLKINPVEIEPLNKSWLQKLNMVSIGPLNKFKETYQAYKEAKLKHLMHYSQGSTLEDIQLHFTESSCEKFLEMFDEDALTKIAAQDDVTAAEIRKNILIARAAPKRKRKMKSANTSRNRAQAEFMKMTAHDRAASAAIRKYNTRAEQTKRSKVSQPDPKKSQVKTSLNQDQSELTETTAHDQAATGAITKYNLKARQTKRYKVSQPDPKESQVKTSLNQDQSELTKRTAHDPVATGAITKDNKQAKQTKKCNYTLPNKKNSLPNKRKSRSKTSPKQSLTEFTMAELDKVASAALLKYKKRAGQTTRSKVSRPNPKKSQDKTSLNQVEQNTGSAEHYEKIRQLVCNLPKSHMEIGKVAGEEIGSGVSALGISDAPRVRNIGNVLLLHNIGNRSEQAEVSHTSHSHLYEPLEMDEDSENESVFKMDALSLGGDPSDCEIENDSQEVHLRKLVAFIQGKFPSDVIYSVDNLFVYKLGPFVCKAEGVCCKTPAICLLSRPNTTITISGPYEMHPDICNIASPICVEKIPLSVEMKLSFLDQQDPISIKQVVLFPNKDQPRVSKSKNFHCDFGIFYFLSGLGKAETLKPLQSSKLENFSLENFETGCYVNDFDEPQPGTSTDDYLTSELGFHYFDTN